MIGRVIPARPVTRQPAGPLAGRLRLARVGVLGLSAYGLALGAHVAAGGAAPGWPVSVMLATLLGVLGVAFTARRRGIGTLLAVLVATQAVLHGLFSLLEAPAAGCSMLTTGHHTVTAVCGSAGSWAMLLPSVPMLLAHLLATVATAWLLARGEAWLWRTLRRVLNAGSPRRPASVPRVPAPGPEPEPGLTVRLWADAPRGPPSRRLVTI
jgi:hypothetical protein